MTAVLDPRLPPSARLLLMQIAQIGAGLLNVRAERIYLRSLFRDWPERCTEQLLTRLRDRAEAFPTTGGERRKGARA